MAIKAFAPAMEGRAGGIVVGAYAGCKPRILVAIALANKMARAIWAMLMKGVDFRDPLTQVA